MLKACCTEQRQASQMWDTIGLSRKILGYQEGAQKKNSRSLGSPLSFSLLPGSDVEDLPLPLLEAQSNEVTLPKTRTSRTIR